MIVRAKDMVYNWLPLEQRISYRKIALVWRSLLGLPNAYLRDLCCTTLGVPDCRSLRSTEQGFLSSLLVIVPFAAQEQQNRAFSVVCSEMGNHWHYSCSLEFFQCS